MKKLLFFLTPIILFSCEKEYDIPDIELSIVPTYGDSSTWFIFQARNSHYIEKSLKYNWDFDSDGVIDLSSNNQNQVVSKSFHRGWNTATVEVILKNGTIITQQSNYLVLTPNQDTSSIIDSRDNTTYQTVKINKRWWFAENLKYGHVITSDSISSDNEQPEMFVWEDQIGNLNSYGGLYTWFELMDYDPKEKARGLCPEGWHIPSADEWKELVFDSLPMQIVWNCVQQAGYWNLNLIPGLYYKLDEGEWTSLPEKNSQIAPYAVNYWTSSFQTITVPRKLDPIPYVGRLPYNKNGFVPITNGYGESLQTDPYKDIYPVRCIKDE